MRLLRALGQKRRVCISLILRLLVSAALLMAPVIRFATPIEAQQHSNSIQQICLPSPPSFVANTGGNIEEFWWKITFGTTPVYLTHEIFNPQGQSIHLDEWTFAGSHIPASGNITLMSDNTSPIYNPENDGGVSDDIKESRHSPLPSPGYAHQVLIPANALPGVYVSRLTYYSQDLSGNPNSPALLGPFDSRSELTFLVKQTLRIFKYHDLDGNGAWEGAHFPFPGEGEPGLDDWEFRVVGPPDAFGPGINVFTGSTSGGGFLDLPPLEVSGNYTIIETLQPGWINTDPPDGPPVQKTVHIPGGVGPPDFEVRFGNQDTVSGTAITVNPDPPSLNAPWALTVPNGAIIEDSGFSILANLPAGQYTLTWLNVDGWTTPLPGSETKLLAAGGSIEFSGTYTRPAGAGDANGDGLVNMGDVTKVELIVLGLTESTSGADANGDGVVNMGDVTKIELMILGLS